MELYVIFVPLRFQKKCKDQQRLTGWDIEKLDVCDSPNLFERLGGGNNVPPAIFVVSSRQTKVTDSRQTEDQLTRDMLAATAGVINCVNGVNGDGPTEITREDTDVVIQGLLGADAYTIAMHIEGEDKFGTSPIRDAYFAMGHTDLVPGLEAIRGFIPKAAYPSPMKALRSEWGSAGNLRYLISSVGSFEPNASVNGANRYNLFCTGMEAYACIEQDGYSAQFIYRPPIYDGPLALNASVGYKFAEVPRILNDQWITNLRCTLPV